MTMNELQALWPNDIEDFSKGKAIYAQKTVTVARVGDYPERVQIKFTEDTTQDGEYTGVWWTVDGGWDEQSNRSKRYDGPIPTQGQQITVILSAKKGDTRFFRDCKIMDEVRVNPQGERTFDRETQPVAPESTAQPDYADPPHMDPVSEGDPRTDPQRKSIEKQVYVMETGRALMAVMGLQLDGEKVFTQEQIEWMTIEWFNGMYELKHGRPAPPQTEETDAE